MRDYGPYDEPTVASFVREGRLLLHDKARDAATGREGTVEELLRSKGIRAEAASGGSLSKQLAHVGTEFIYPHADLAAHSLMADKRLLALAGVGLGLSVIMLFPVGGYLAFYVISLYFALIWGLFFAYFFRTRQVSWKTTASTFFLTQAGVFVIFSGLNRLNVFYLFTHAPFPFSVVGFILGVGLTEELAKMLPLLIIEHRSREPLLPQTMVYYGLMAGIAFGVFEGVEYQTTVNIQADYVTAFVLNIARLTSLPFLHATASMTRLRRSPTSYRSASASSACSSSWPICGRAADLGSACDNSVFPFLHLFREYSALYQKCLRTLSTLLLLSLNQRGTEYRTTGYAS